MPSLIIENLDYTSAAVTPVTDPSNIYYNSAYDADDESDQEDPNSAYRAQKIKTRNAKTRRNRVTIKNPPHPKYPPYQTSSSFPHLDTSSEILDIRKDDDDDDDDIATTGPTVTPIQMMTERVNQKRQKQKEMAPEKLILHRPILTCSCSRCIQILKTVQTLSHLRDICSVSCDHDDSKIGWQQGVQRTIYVLNNHARGEKRGGRYDWLKDYSNHKGHEREVLRILKQKDQEKRMADLFNYELSLKHLKDMVMGMVGCQCSKYVF